MRGMDEGRRTRFRAAPLVAVVVLLLLPVLYVLASGPLVALVSNGYISDKSTLYHALEVIYWPLAFCADHCQPFASFLEAYMKLCGAKL